MTTTPPVRVQIRSVAIPNEHGGWGFTLEPVLLGLLVAASWSGLGLGFLALGLFLARHPFKLFLSDVLKGKRFPRTALAGWFVLGYGFVALTGFWAAVHFSQASFFIPLLVAIPLIAIQMWFDSRNKGRNLLPELSGAIAMGSVAAAIAMSAGVSTRIALGLWLVLAARSVMAIFYARAQVGRARGKSVSTAPVYVCEILCITVLAVAAFVGIVPWLSVVAVAMLLPFSVITFGRPPVAAKVVGWAQMVFGVGIVFATAVGSRFSW